MANGPGEAVNGPSDAPLPTSNILLSSLQDHQHSALRFCSVSPDACHPTQTADAIPTVREGNSQATFALLRPAITFLSGFTVRRAQLDADVNVHETCIHGNLASSHLTHREYARDIIRRDALDLKTCSTSTGEVQVTSRQKLLLQELGLGTITVYQSLLYSQCRGLLRRLPQASG